MADDAGDQAEDGFDFNQPQLRGDEDLWADDRALRDHALAQGADGARLAVYGRRLGQAEIRDLGAQANRHAPRLLDYDRGGRRLDQVEFHPAYHRLMQLGVEAGYSSVAWSGAAGGHVTHAAMVYLHTQVDPGTCCPMTMSYAAVSALQRATDAGDWIGKLLTGSYDPRFLPLSAKTGATLGMAMTERQGGSDVRRNLTAARRVSDGYLLEGHKWFCSAPMSDGFLTLAQAPGGLSCFLVPRVMPDGRQNAIRINRFKDKLGNRSNASAEIEYHGAWAQIIGAEGEGVRAILPMVHHTRLDTAMAPAGLMRAALREAHHWCTGRSVFQRRLIDQPLMRAVLADLALEWEAALALGLRVAAAYDAPDAHSRSLSRIAVALAKFLSNKRCPGLIYEAMEALGGMGYVEDTPLPLLYREAPLNSIWEGSGNVICLDILRTLHRDGAAGAALDRVLDGARGAVPGYDRALDAHRARWPAPPQEGEARWFAERLAMLLSAAALIEAAPSQIAEAYVSTRLSRESGHVAGAVAGLPEDAILARLAPG